MLFPMERLFEQYVAIWVRRNLAADTTLTTQAKSLYLCEQEGRDVFCLKPDLLLKRGEQRWILDTKWKHIDATQRGKNYSLSQADFYQLYAYGQKYLKGQGEMALIYPGHSRFVGAFEPFDFDDKLRLWVLPFDLEAATLQMHREAAFPFLRTLVDRSALSPFAFISYDPKRPPLEA